MYLYLTLTERPRTPVPAQTIFVGIDDSTVTMVEQIEVDEVENMVRRDSGSNLEDDEDEEMFDIEVHSLLSLPSLSSSSASSFSFYDDDEDVEGDKTCDPWADEDTADLRAHYADGWRVPKPKRPLGKRRRVQELASYDDEEQDEDDEKMRGMLSFFLSPYLEPR